MKRVPWHWKPISVQLWVIRMRNVCSDGWGLKPMKYLLTNVVQDNLTINRNQGLLRVLQDIRSIHVHISDISIASGTGSVMFDKAWSLQYSLRDGQHFGQLASSISGPSTALGMLLPMEDAHVANAAETPNERRRIVIHDLILWYKTWAVNGGLCNQWLYWQTRRCCSSLSFLVSSAPILKHFCPSAVSSTTEAWEHKDYHQELDIQYQYVWMLPILFNQQRLLGKMTKNSFLRARTQAQWETSQQPSPHSHPSGHR